MSESQPKSKFSDGFHQYFSSGKMLKRQPLLDSTGLASISLEMLFNDMSLAKGTGFFWRQPNGVALVTAWHNFSGLHHTSRFCLSKSGGIPNRLKIRYTAKLPEKFQGQEFSIYKDDSMDNPAWNVHKACGNFFDIAYINLQLNDHDVFCANDNIDIQKGRLLPGTDVFVIGYPQGVSSIGVIPLWKRGSIASEIDLPTEGHPKFLIDIAGRGGMSGAPVYRVQRGIIVEETGDEKRVGVGNKIEFMGLYSGRAADQLPPSQRSLESSDLGYVWRPEIVSETLTDGVPDEKPEPGKGKLELKPIWKKQPAE